MFAGSREIRITDSVTGVNFPVLVHYPTETASEMVKFGPYEMEVSVDAPIADGAHPLVVISHGSGGSHLLYRTLSLHLAKDGYVVAIPQHPGNNRHDNSLADTAEVLRQRPRHVSLVIDTVAPEAKQVAVIGHSLGGYTGLALAGGVPYTRERERIEVKPDPRVAALVLLAPATPFFGAEGLLRQVTVPILVVTGQQDEMIPRQFTDIVLNGVPDRSQVDWWDVENAGHYSFLSPFPEALCKPGFLPAMDLPGFDRAAFHEELAARVLRFLDTHLKGQSPEPA